MVLPWQVRRETETPGLALWPANGGIRFYLLQLGLDLGKVFIQFGLPKC